MAAMDEPLMEAVEPEGYPNVEAEAAEKARVEAENACVEGETAEKARLEA
eukprot:CAMPEP_0185774106 /NCGR_PEP_ID=MMETSP1174-20130828/76763_1 /TAXON_ID=35687 /ORGANISM="Dictyocha speculum, Strain CCMP1381" /LENGTH=49 /DNA_ID= /DNA_START= /DNA_END= /DNA_ORIENTATION=